MSDHPQSGLAFIGIYFGAVGGLLIIVFVFVCIANKWCHDNESTSDGGNRPYKGGRGGGGGGGGCGGFGGGEEEAVFKKLKYRVSTRHVHRATALKR